MPIHITLPDDGLDAARPDPVPGDPSPAALAPVDPLDDPIDLALSDQQRCFVLEYIIDFNGTAAAARAGHPRRGASQWAAQTIRRPEVKAAIRRELKAREGRTRVTGDRIVAEIERIAFADPARIARWSPHGVTLLHSDDLTPDDRAAVKRIALGAPKGKGNRRAQHIEMHDKLGALALLARLTGMLTREPGGRFALLDESADRGARQDANAILRERLLRIARGAAKETREAKGEGDGAAAKAECKTGR